MNFQILNISWCVNITDDSIRILGHHQSFYNQRYNQRYENVDSKNPRFHNDKILYASYTNLSDEGIKHLWKYLILNLSNCKNITDEGIKFLGNVNTLNLSECNNITDEGVKFLGNLHSLNVSGCNKITNEGVKYLGNLHTLNISGCRVSDISCLSNIIDLNASVCKCK